MLDNRGEAIDFLCDTYSQETRLRVLKEAHIYLPAAGRMAVWLYRAEGRDDPPEDDQNNFWLTADETLLVTNLFNPSICEAYKQARGIGLADNEPLKQMEDAMRLFEEKITRASFDERLVKLVETVEDLSKHPLDYQEIETLLDQLEQDYELSPFEMVQTYQRCEDRQKAAQEIAIDG